MKKLFFNYILIISTCLFIASGCSDTNNDFIGDDCNFVTFSLTVDGVVYPAKISGNDISVSLPYGIDIYEAEVNYRLNENATVQPDPNSIKDWNADQMFRVQSYNNNFNTFIYSLSRTDNTNSEDIILSSQQDVDDFAKKKINHIKGNLIVGEYITDNSDEEPITNLDGLYDLVQVDYNIVIKGGYKGKDLFGLSNLKSVGGFYIGSSTSTENSIEKLSIILPNLETIGNILINSDNVEDISLPKVIEVADIYIKSQSLSKLDLPALRNSYGNFSLSGVNSSINEFIIPNLTKVLGNFVVANLQALSIVNIMSLEEVNGNCEFTTLPKLELVSYPSLKKVGGSFTLTGNTALTKIIAPELQTANLININNGNMFSSNLKSLVLSNITNVENSITIQFPAFEELKLESLKSVGESIIVQNASLLELIETPMLQNCKFFRVTGAPQLKYLNIQDVNNLEKLDILNFNNLEKLQLPKIISGDVTISASAGSNYFPTLGKLEKIEGSLTISNYTKDQLIVKGLKEVGKFSFVSFNRTIELISFPELEKSGDYSIGSIENITTLSLAKLKESKSISIQNCPLLTNMDLSGLSKIESQLQLAGNQRTDTYKLTNLDAFSSLTSVGSVNIQYAWSLKDFKGLENAINGLTSNNWNINNCGYNPTLQDMLEGRYTE